MVHHHLNKLVFLAFILFIMLQGCTSGISGSVSKTDDGEYTQVLQSDSKLLLTRIGIREIKAGQAGDLMRANIVLHNRWHLTLDFSYQVRWFDRDGLEIDPGSYPWHPIVMAGKADLTVQSTAPRASATQFKIYVKD